MFCSIHPHRPAPSAPPSVRIMLGSITNTPATHRLLVISQTSHCMWKFLPSQAQAACLQEIIKACSAGRKCPPASHTVGETRIAALFESAAISPPRPLLLWLIYEWLMLLHLRQLLEQFLLYSFVFFYKPRQNPCAETCFVKRINRALPFVPVTTRCAWLVVAASCFLVLLEPQKLVPHISAHDVTDQHDACAAPWCC